MISVSYVSMIEVEMIEKEQDVLFGKFCMLVVCVQPSLRLQCLTTVLWRMKSGTLSLNVWGATCYQIL